MARARADGAAMKKWIGWIVLAIVVAGVGFGVWRWKKSHEAPEVQWKTSPAEKRSITARVTASGTLQATVTVQVGAQVSGRISKLAADFNSTVKKGELIAKIDPQLFQAAVEQSKANFASAKAQVAKAEAQQRDAELVYDRTKQLSNEALASAADLQTAETNVSVAKAATDVARASLEQASASLHQAQVNLSYTNIYSPIDGTVISRSVDVGQTVAASLQAPVLFTIAEDLRKMQVHTSVAEGDVGRLEPGMAATFTVDAFPGQSFVGRVGQIRNAAQTVQNVVTYDAVIDVDNADLRLRPGMTATVTIVYAERHDVTAIPNAAIRFRPPPEIASALATPPPLPASAPGGSAAPARSGREHGEGARAGARAGGGGAAGAHGRAHGGGASGDPSKIIYVLEGGRPEARRIVTGLSDGTVSEIATGDVKPGDEVVTDVVLGAGASPAGGGTSGRPPRLGRMFR